MEALRQWLLGVVACALLVSIAEQLCPEGRERGMVRFTGGLLLLLAMLRPLSGFAPPEAMQGAAEYREALAALEPELETARENALTAGIASALNAYIEDKAGSLGADVRAEAAVEAADGVPLVRGVTLHGAYCGTLSAWLTSELGIAKEKQIWIENE